MLTRITSAIRDVEGTMGARMDRQQEGLEELAAFAVGLGQQHAALQSQQEQLHVASYPDPRMEGRPFADRVDAAVRHYAAEGQCFVLNATALLDDAARAALYDTAELASLDGEYEL